MFFSKVICEKIIIEFKFIFCSTRDLFRGPGYASSGSGIGGGRLSSGGSGGAWRLPVDKLRIVKNLEGSLTLHHWQRLAVPHLGNVLEERSGVAVRGAKALMPAVVPVSAVGGDFAAIDSGLELPAPSSKNTSTEEERPPGDSSGELGEAVKLDDVLDEKGDIQPRRRGPAATLPLEDTRTHQTFTDSTILHPDDRPPSNMAQVELVSSYGAAPQMSSGFLRESGDRLGDADADSMSVASLAFDSVSVAGHAAAGGGGDFTRASSRLSLASTADEYASSRLGSVSDLSFAPESHYGSLGRRRNQLRGFGGGTLTFSNNIGLARVLNERDIHGYMSASNLSLNTNNHPGSSQYYGSSGAPSEFQGSVACSLTPSVISTPACEKSFSPTGTPLNSPCHTPPSKPKEKYILLTLISELFTIYFY